MEVASKEEVKKARNGLYGVGVIILAIFLYAGVIMWSSTKLYAQDFALIDTDGSFHQMSYYSNYEQIAIMTASAQSSEDAKLRFSSTTIGEVGQKTKFFFLNPTGEPRDTEQNDVYDDIPMLMDDAKIVSKALGLTQLNEVVYMDTGTMEVGYRTVLEEGEPIETDWGEPSYVNDIAPILIDNCVTCHRYGGIGPWAMNNHPIVQAFSPAIADALLTKWMPPGQLDPVVGEFSNDMNLTNEEQQKLSQWIANGSPGDYNE